MTAYMCFTYIGHELFWETVRDFDSRFEFSMKSSIIFVKRGDFTSFLQESLEIKILKRNFSKI